MGHQKHQPGKRSVWPLARKQHGVISRRQLLDLGFTDAGIKHRLDSGRLHRVERGIYVVGRPELSQWGRWMAAVLSCGPTAVLSHRSAAALWGIYPTAPSAIDVSVRHLHPRRRARTHVYRRPGLQSFDIQVHEGIPATVPVRTLVDLATQLPPARLERAVNEADRLGLTDPESLLDSLDLCPGVPGVGRLRSLLKGRTFSLTDSELERRFLALVHAAGLPRPLTQQQLNGFRVDFFWPQLGLVVETDGLRYHRTPAQQARDRLRDQAHASSGLTPLRFTHAQVRFEAPRVKATLTAVARRLEGQRRPKLRV